MLFFFSSRRRHTRCLSDWSSDVCSSDLDDRRPGGGAVVPGARRHRRPAALHPRPAGQRAAARPARRGATGADRTHGDRRLHGVPLRGVHRGGDRAVLDDEPVREVPDHVLRAAGAGPVAAGRLLRAGRGARRRAARTAAAVDRGHRQPPGGRRDGVLPVAPPSRRPARDRAAVDPRPAAVVSDLDGKVALVTGGNRGIGRGIVEALHGAGATVYLTSREAGRAEAAAREIGPRAKGLAADVRREDQVKRAFEVVAREAGGLDVLVNNAGVGEFAPVADMSADSWRNVIETNLNGVYYCCHEAIPLMRRRGGGYIFNISSLAGKNPIQNGAAYNASKFGLNGFSEALMMEVRYDGIRVSYLMPGSVATEFGRGSAAKGDWALQPEDVGDVVLALLRSPARAMYSRVEMRPSQPPRRG